MKDIEIEKVDYHRNGISGEGFYVVHFKWSEYGPVQSMMGVVFETDELRDKEGYWLPESEMPFHNPRVAVFDKALLPSTEFGHNSWRGDHFAPALYEACRKWDADLSKRLGGSA